MEEFEIPDYLTDEMVRELRATSGGEYYTAAERAAYRADSVKIPRKLIDILIEGHLHSLEHLYEQVTSFAELRAMVNPLSEEEVQIVAESCAAVIKRMVDLHRILDIVMSLEGSPLDPE